ncbi:MAG TPA: GNAT family N-acetyltransferase [Symbiobacteriaceae bacterium]|nr:GNAT family N-acetyltransferase [Symbiobacteriaceae bacterium]
MVIQGNGLRIRPLRDCPADIAAMARWLSDPRVLEFYEGRDRPHDEELVRQVFIIGMAGTDEVACIVEYEGRPLGYVQFYPLDEAGLREYGCSPGLFTYGMDQFIGEPAYWCRGLGTAMIRLVVDHLVRERGAQRVVMDPVVSNGRAIRAYEKCGFRKVRVLPQKEYAEGCWHDCWLMEYRP